ncbi:MAG: EVE domain-containing protein [candidate division Zixibacteria bacterium]|nr:EVE domain-containing protein [candidate division Zixibacteria bacterium]
MKTEPNAFSIQHLEKLPNKTTHWDGVRNYQARNTLRDDIKKGDGVLFYHSIVDPPLIVGECVITRSGYPDHTAFDPSEKHFDPKSDPQNPRWFMVDLKLKRIFKRQISLSEIRLTPGLEKMEVAKRGQRLSVMPVTPKEWEIVLKLAGK